VCVYVNATKGGKINFGPITRLKKVAHSSGNISLALAQQHIYRRVADSEAQCVFYVDKRRAEV
jgi:hypothetical protein